MRSALYFAGVLTIFAAACGGEKVEAKAPEAASSAAEEHHGPKLQMSSELGEIDPKETQKTFDKLQTKFQGCYKKGLTRVEYLSGDVKFFLRLTQDAAVKFAYIEESNLGDRATERCMLDAIGSASWPKPKGGEAEIRNGIGFDAAADVRRPADWNSDKLAAVLGKSDAVFAKCREGISGSFKVTAYVEPDGKNGKVQAVGVAPPSKEGETKVDCVVDAVKALKLPSPGSYAAKVSFVL